VERRGDLGGTRRVRRGVGSVTAAQDIGAAGPVERVVTAAGRVVLGAAVEAVGRAAAGQGVAAGTAGQNARDTACGELVGARAPEDTLGVRDVVALTRRAVEPAAAHGDRDRPGAGGVVGGVEADAAVEGVAALAVAVARGVRAGRERVVAGLAVE